ncbi:uncharacterized protein YciI [Paraburkholderia sp. GAS199]|uniref:YciI family protein n=1 Tax=Paraburkholderia sp. GAS199 TaxID=3035126 RepID=UPI003D1D26B0
MFYIVISCYVKSPELDVYMAEHMNFLEKHHRDGIFLLSGYKSTCDGNVTIARSATRADLIEILELDPLRKLGLIDYQIIGFALNMRALMLTEELFLCKGAVSHLAMDLM